MPLPTIPMVGNPCFEHQCSDCCHDIEMILTNDDLARIQGVVTGHPELDGDWWFTADDGFLQLRTREAAPGQPRPCWFLRSGRCSIHDDRPEGCRLFPAVWDEGLRRAHLDDDYCPHTGGFRLTKQVEDGVRRLGDKLHAEAQARA